jgi:diaminopimelate epimerase
VRYAKGHGTGNDFIILPDVDDRLDLNAALIRRLCDRRTGIGADGVLRVVRGGAADPGDAAWLMDYRNADGSVAEMCGNGIRVFARYLLDHGLAAGPDLAIGTSAGTRLVRDEGGGLFSVDMGPVTTGEQSWAIIGGRKRAGLAITVGNPHLACVVDEPVAGFDLTVPPEFDRAAFPDGVNVEVVRLTGDRAVEMRVRERGSGETLSCGTGAVAAAAAAAAALGEWPSDRTGPWAVQVPGGKLTVAVATNTSLLTGPAVIVAEGEILDSWLSSPG